MFNIPKILSLKLLEVKMKSERGHIVFQNDFGDIQGRGLKTTDAACSFKQSTWEEPSVPAVRGRQAKGQDRRD